MKRTIHPVHPWSWRSLQTRVTVLTLSAFLVSIWSLSLFAVHTLHEDVLQLQGDQQMTNLTLHADSVNLILSERLASLEAITPRITPALIQSPVDLQNFLVDRLALPVLFNGGFFVTDAAGTAIASLPVSAHRAGVNYMERDHVASALRRGVSTISKPIVGKQLLSPVVSMAVPIRDAHGRRIGCVVGVIDLGRPNFLDQMLSAHYGKTGGYMLIASQWRIVVSATDKRHTLRDLPDVGIHPELERFIQGHEGTVVMQDLQGVEVLASAVRVPVAGWSMVVMLPVDEAFGPIHHLVGWIGLAAFMASLLAGTLTWWLLRRQLRPVHEAFRSLMAQAESEQPLLPLPRTSDDEVGQLISGFNYLIQRLAEHEADCRQSEQTIRNLALRLDEAQKLSQLGSWTLDIKTGALDWSPEIYRLFELSPQEFGGTYEAFLDVIHPDDRKTVNDAYLTSLSLRTPYQIEHRLLMADGRVKWVQERCRSEFDAMGTALRSVGTVQDITDRKLAETAIAEAHQLLMTVIDAIPMRIFWKGVHLNFLGCNTEFAREAGKQSPSELVGRDDFQTRWADQAYVYREDDRKVIVSGLPKLFYDDCETRPDGQTLWLRKSKVPLRNQSGQVFGVLGIIEDVTQRKLAEERVRQLSQIAEQSPESVVVADLAATIVYVNATFVRNTGYAREEAIGQNPRILQSDLTSRSTYDIMWETLVQGKTWSGEFVNRRKDGSIYHEWAIISPLRNTHNVITHYVAVKEDITEKRRIADELDQHRHRLEELVRIRTAELDQARQQADAANRSKSFFLANMSHEIRTPMNGVIGMIDVIMQTPMSASQRRMLTIIHNSSMALLRILNDILDFSKIEAGKLELEHVPTHLREVVEGSVLLMQNAAGGKDAEISLFFDPTLPEWILSDHTRLRQILINLLSNALKFTSHRASQIMLHVQPAMRPDGTLCVQFSIIDNGIGMSADTVARLFQPFTQADTGTMRRFGGTGLGLSITHRLVDLLNGTIKVQSAQGIGSEFTVEIPITVTAVPPDHPRLQLPDLHGVSVLTVASSVATLTMFQMYLGAAGAQVTVVPDVSTARQQMARATTPTVVLLDSTHNEHRSPQSPGQFAVPVRDDDHAGIVRLVPRGRSGTSIHAIDVPTWPLLYTDLLRAVGLACGRLDIHDTAHAGAHPSHLPCRPVPDPETAARSGSLILVADDNETNRDVIHEQLKLLGYASEVASDGLVAWTMWRTGRYGLLLTDCHMPLMDGFELTAAIRQDEGAGPRKPIIAITADIMQADIDWCKSHGMDDYLCKPLRLQALGAMLAHWLPLPTVDQAAADAHLQMDADVDPDPDGASGISGISDTPARTSGDVSGFAAEWDATALSHLVGRDPAVLQRLFERFLHNTAQQLLDIDQALGTQDIAKLTILAHTLKSASRSVGAMALGDLCQSLETASKSGHTTACLQMARALPAALAAAVTHIRQHLDASVDGL